MTSRRVIRLQDKTSSNGPIVLPSLDEIFIIRTPYLLKLFLSRTSPSRPVIPLS
ncbi:hypothetical protein LptCag_1906 [Leptospirillum ferriphilum]|uniref:Uncharacterized protein n=1 Tax=Leptospirillum ferriphilum TaxID=178606 RepID=A0A094YJ29_9BACT|nr:hypothetical protein LptCag_1906 [Leptospirillum ferriphilum]